MTNWCITNSTPNFVNSYYPKHNLCCNWCGCQESTVIINGYNLSDRNGVWSKVDGPNDLI